MNAQRTIRKEYQPFAKSYTYRANGSPISVLMPLKTVRSDVLQRRKHAVEPKQYQICCGFKDDFKDDILECASEWHRGLEKTFVYNDTKIARNHNTVIINGKSSPKVSRQKGTLSKNHIIVFGTESKTETIKHI